MAAQAGLAANDVFGLLAVRREVAGALVIAADEPSRATAGWNPTTRRLAKAVEDLEDHPLGAHDDFRASLSRGCGRPPPGRLPAAIQGEAECLPSPARYR